MRNVHSRRIGAPAGTVGALLDTLAGDGDRLWPSPAWPPLRLDGGLRVGAAGGHGPIRYRLGEYEPGRRVRFTFAPRAPLDGYHEFTVAADGDDASVITHEIRARPRGLGVVLWPVLLRWMHDDLLEELLDNAERHAAGPVARPHRRGPWVRLCRRLLGPAPRW
ncbi:SRPBCC family protein [Glycomyces terrestris]|uniref:SRPBCC family protein n=1 Tax=Glycomyces terrestris TaxID=2493553 RepID=A0A426V486_9ACTN|nr:SRPBCC family protein [Glycomyces terrestris]RRS01729.1 SRPBCC family protein [Glycomyces terrestris]